MTILYAAIAGLALGAGYDLQQFGKSRRALSGATFNWTLAFYRWVGGSLTAVAGALAAVNA